MSTSAHELEVFGPFREVDRPDLKLVETEAQAEPFFSLDSETEPNFNQLSKLVEDERTTPATIVFAVLQENGLVPTAEAMHEMEEKQTQLEAKPSLDDGELLHIGDLEADLEPIKDIQDRIQLAIDYFHAHYFTDGLSDSDKIDVEIYTPTELYNSSSFLGTFIKLRQLLQRNNVRRLSSQAQANLREAENVARLLVKDEIEDQA